MLDLQRHPVVDPERARPPDRTPSSGPRERWHVCVVTETFPPEINGVALTLAHLVGGLRARGYAVSIVRPRQGWMDPAGDLGDPALTLVPGLALPGYRGLRMGLPAGATLRARWRQRPPDVVYVATEGPLGWSAVRAARRLRLPVLGGFHTNFHVYARHYHAGWVERIIARYLRRFHNRTTGTVVPTADLRDQLRRVGFRNVSVLGRGVDGRLFTPARRSASLRRAWGVSDADPVALCVGRVAPEKNIRLAIAAYRAMQQVVRPCRLVIVGDGPSRGALERANPDLFFAGMLTGEPLATHFASADLFLFPSETETFGNVVLEALASGLVVVAYDYAAARAHVMPGRTGTLVPCGDARAFVEGAVALAAAPERFHRMRQHVRDSVAHLHWDRVVERFEGLLADVSRVPTQAGSIRTGGGDRR
ncbi:MAG TPA: glycosyltransferase family 1 protein [Methylomirabilota bacterium]|jgi:glycosyltransferase involved in cell wall biosynthesis